MTHADIVAFARVRHHSSAAFHGHPAPAPGALSSRCPPSRLDPRPMSFARLRPTGKWSESGTAGRLRLRHRQPGVPPEGPAHRSPKPGRGRSARRAAAAAAAAKRSRKITFSADLYSYGSKKRNKKTPDVGSCWELLLPQAVRLCAAIPHW